MFDITKRKQFKTVGELKEILRDIPDNTRVYICGEDTDSCWFHVENDGSIVSFDGNDLDDEYCDNPMDDREDAAWLEDELMSISVRGELVPRE